jgi:hypothetical protein
MELYDVMLIPAYKNPLFGVTDFLCKIGCINRNNSTKVEFGFFNQDFPFIYMKKKYFAKEEEKGEDQKEEEGEEGEDQKEEEGEEGEEEEDQEEEEREDQEDEGEEEEGEEEEDQEEEEEGEDQEEEGEEEEDMKEE